MSEAIWWATFSSGFSLGIAITLAAALILIIALKEPRP